ncbi:putative tributyrin esterase [Pedobacter africanus]|uniref:Enterochelin esterase-like enzyme n=1 Tax=Pedobacter africanus TaxID=151894 RepID=A0ACC6KVG5_9SPHI|nr:alpha/beta hydrolase-fold protein [Pedobacter africanus]MDR6783206.1 enterochelin esterase-like enzyme [Pedobacter africanus]
MSAFRTIEISNPKYEKDNLRFITVGTENLAGRGDICVFVPPGSADLRNLPVVILLHGVYGSAWSWAYRSGVHLQAMEMIRKGMLPNMIIAMPSDGLWGDGSAYLPHHGHDFENWIVTDVPQALQEVLPQVSPQSVFFISGLSMGGFGALRIGVKHHSLFKAVSAHSAITDLEQMPFFTTRPQSAYKQANPVDESVLATLLKNKTNVPPLRFDCGNNDLLVRYNRTLHEQLKSQSIAHQYEEFEGGHEWPYWEKHISRSLLFFASHL